MASAAEQLAANFDLSTFRKAEDLKKRLWFTLFALLIFRLGTYLPIPGIDTEVMRSIVPPTGKHTDSAQPRSQQGFWRQD